MRKKLFYAANILLPLTLGTHIYALYRPDTWISVQLYRLTGFQAHTPPLFAAGIFRNYLPDMLWAYALSFSVGSIYRSGKVSFALSTIFAASLELLQRPGILPGTFDWMDIILEVCITALAALIIESHEKKENGK